MWRRVNNLILMSDVVYFFSLCLLDMDFVSGEFRLALMDGKKKNNSLSKVSQF